MFEMMYLGHAGWLVEKQGFKCAFDPWCSAAGAFFDQWAPFPDNSKIDFKTALDGLDFLYISHSHEDHFNKSTLSTVNRETQILIPNFKDKTLLTGLKNMGFRNIKQLNPDDRININNVTTAIIIYSSHKTLT